MHNAPFRTLAPNAYSLNFDPALLTPLRQDYQDKLAAELQARPELLEGVYYQSESMAHGNYYALSYDTYPLLWVTNHNAKTHALFQDFCESLPLDFLKEQIKPRKQLIMYSGFFVLGNRASEEMWHYDYRSGAKAYTLITPLFDWQAEHGGLLYKPDHAGNQENAPSSVYTYRCGEAIVFGEGFLHSTEPYAPSQDLRVLVSFTLGSDRWRDWEIIRQNIEEQSYFYLQPCGHPVSSCDCEARWQKRRWWQLKN